MIPTTHKREVTIGDRTISIETGKLARQADGAVVVNHVDDGHGVDPPLGVHRAQDPVVVRRQPGPRLVLGEPHRVIVIRRYAGGMNPALWVARHGRLRPDDAAEFGDQFGTVVREDDRADGTMGTSASVCVAILAALDSLRQRMGGHTPTPATATRAT